MTDIHRVTDRIWTVEGPPVSFYGFSYSTRMVLVRRAEGTVWVWSPIPLQDELKPTIDEWGRVRDLVEPNRLHHLFLEDWTRAYPDARCYGTAGLVQKHRDLGFGGELDGTDAFDWSDDLPHVLVSGSFLLEEAVFFHRASGSLIVGDLIQRHDPDEQRGWRGRLMRWDGLVGPRGSTPREWRWTFWNRSAARAARDRILEWPIENLIVAHGTCVFGGARPVVREALQWI